MVKYSSDAQLLFNIFWADQSHFSLHGESNIHNYRIWAEDILRVTILKRHNIHHMSQFDILFIKMGHYFFDEISVKVV